MNINNLTLGFDNKSFAANGDTLYRIQNIDDLVNITNNLIDVDKQKLPCTYVYCGVKGIFNGSNIVNIDIDTNYGVDDIISNIDLLFNNVPDVLFVQKSYSNKLHIVYALDRVYYDEQEYINNAALATAYVIAIINKLYNIDYYNLINSHNVRVVDDHNLGWYQKLALSSNEVIVNNNFCQQYSYATILSLNEYLHNNYSDLFVKCRKQQNKSECYKLNVNEYTSLDVQNKIKIDRNVVIKDFNNCELRGNDIRWRISVIANELFGEGAKLWCDERFYYDNNKSIYTNTSVTSINISVLNWLIENGYISKSITENENKPQISNIQCDDKHKVNSYLSEEYYDFIKETILSNNVTTIISGTGTGKTKLINELAGEMNAVIATPFNAMRSLYNGNIVEKVEHNLFGVERIKGTKTIEVVKANDYTGENSVVMVYDQLVKVNDELLKDKVIFIDECHIMFIDRDYRKSLIKLIEKLKSIKDICKIVLVSATPLDEVNLFGKSKVLEFYKNRSIINTTIVNFDKPLSKKTYIEKIINSVMIDNKYNYMNKYDRILVFSDNYCKNIYYNLTTKYSDEKIGILHTVKPEELDVIKETELLTKPVYMSTKVAFNGLNFKNTDEKVLCFVDYEIGNDLSWKIIQSVGRCRFCNVDLCLCVSEMDKTSLSDKLALNNVKKELNLRSVQYNSDYNDEQYVSTLRDIELYVEKHTRLYKEDLIDAGYFNIELECQFNDELKSENVLGKTIDKYVKESISNNYVMTIEKLLDTIKFDDVFENNYFEVLKQKIIVCYYNYMIKEFVSLKNKMLNTTIDKFNMLNNIIDDGSDNVQAKIKELENYLKVAENLHSDDLLTKQIKSIVNELNKYSEIAGQDIESRPGLYKIFGGKDKYIECKKRNAGKRLLKILQDEDKECSAAKKEGGKNGDKVAKSNGGKNGGKMSSPKKKCFVRNLDTNESKTLDSKAEAMEYIGCNSATFSKLVKGITSKRYNYSVVVL